MLDFTVSENLLIMEILGLSPSYLPYMQSQQQNAYSAYGDALLTRVRTLLDEYTILDENEATVGSELKTGLKRLDVIEWFSPDESGNRLSDDRLHSIKNKLIKLLDISILTTSYQGTPMYKG